MDMTSFRPINRTDDLERRVRARVSRSEAPEQLARPTSNVIVMSNLIVVQTGYGDSSPWDQACELQRRSCRHAILPLEVVQSLLFNGIQVFPWKEVKRFVGMDPTSHKTEKKKGWVTKCGNATASASSDPIYYHIDTESTQERCASE